MITAYQSALSAISGFNTKINSHSNNIANAQSEGYKKTKVLFSTDEQNGVKTTTETINTSGQSYFEQTSNGYELIELSNVDLAEEITQMNLGANLYKANLKTLEVTSEMTEEVLNLKA